MVSGVTIVATFSSSFLPSSLPLASADGVAHRSGGAGCPAAREEHGSLLKVFKDLLLLPDEVHEEYLPDAAKYVLHRYRFCS